MADKTLKEYHYPFIIIGIGEVMDRKSRIIIPDFNIEVEYTDGGIYSSYTILMKIAEYKLQDTIWCYLNDNRELPPPTIDEDELIEKYNESISWLHVKL